MAKIKEMPWPLFTNIQEMSSVHINNTASVHIHVKVTVTSLMLFEI